MRYDLFPSEQTDLLFNSKMPSFSTCITPSTIYVGFWEIQETVSSKNSITTPLVLSLPIIYVLSKIKLKWYI